MLIELGIGAAALGGLWLSRNTKPAKFVRSAVSGWWGKTKLGQSVILANAKDNIKNEFNSEKEKLRNDQLDFNLDKKTFEKKAEYIRFLEFAIESGDTTPEEKEDYKKELETKRGELEILRESLRQKEALIDNREKALDSYQDNVLEKRISEAELAEVVFKQQNQVEQYEKDLENIETLGDSTLTNNVIARYTGTHKDSKIKVARRYELLDKFNKSKDEE